MYDILMKFELRSASVLDDQFNVVDFCQVLNMLFELCTCYVLDNTLPPQAIYMPIHTMGAIC